jgi:hypothetical protein
MADAALETPAVDTPAPAAAPAAPEPSPAAAAAASGDFGAFQRAREAQLRGEAQAGVVAEQKPAEKPAAVEGEKPAAEAKPGAEPVVEQTEAEKQAASEAGRKLAEVKTSRREKREESFQQRIDRLRREAGEEERRLQAARDERARIEADIAARGKPTETVAPAPADDPEPKVGEFDDYEKFVDARATWRARQEVRAAEKRIEDRFAAEKKAREDSERGQRQNADAAAHASRVDAFKATHKDYDAVIEANNDLVIPGPFYEAIPYVESGPALMYHFASHPDHAEAAMELPLTPAIRDAIVQSPAAVALLSHLVTNEGECARIARLPAVRQVAEMGLLEARLASPKTGPTSAAVVVSHAPVPPKPVGNSAAATTATTRDLAVQHRGKEFMAERDRAERERRFGRR